MSNSLLIEYACDIATQAMTDRYDMLFEDMVYWNDEEGSFKWKEEYQEEFDIEFDSVINDKMKELELLSENLKNRIEGIETLILSMPNKGDRPEDCQRMYLIDCLKKLEHAVNGIELDDLIPRNEKED